MQNNWLKRYFEGVLRLRRFLQAEEEIEAGFRKVPVPQRFLWALPLTAFAAAFVATVLAPLLKKDPRR